MHKSMNNLERERERERETERERERKRLEKEYKKKEKYKEESNNNDNKEERGGITSFPQPYKQAIWRGNRPSLSGIRRG